VRNGIEKRVMLLASTDLAKKKNCIQDEARDYQGEEDYPEHEQRDLGEVQEYPANVQCNGENDQADAQNQKEDSCLSPTHRYKVKRKKVKGKRERQKEKGKRQK
jgi:hypothetical protein